MVKNCIQRKWTKQSHSVNPMGLYHVSRVPFMPLIFVAICLLCYRPLHRQNKHKFYRFQRPVFISEGSFLQRECNVTCVLKWIAIFEMYEVSLGNKSGKLNEAEAWYGYQSPIALQSSYYGGQMPVQNSLVSLFTRPNLNPSNLAINRRIFSPLEWCHVSGIFPSLSYIHRFFMHCPPPPFCGVRAHSSIKGS